MDLSNRKYFNFANFLLLNPFWLFIIFGRDSMGRFGMAVIGPMLFFAFVFYMGNKLFFAAMDGKTNHKCFLDLAFGVLCNYGSRNMVFK